MVLGAYEFACAVSLLFYCDLYDILREYSLYEFRPFKEAEATAVKVVLVAHVIDFFQLLDAVEVEVVDGIALSVRVFIDEGEGGRRDDILDTQNLTESLDERCLSSSHLAIECEHFSFSHPFDEFFCCLVDGVEALDCNFHIAL